MVIITTEPPRPERAPDVRARHDDLSALLESAGRGDQAAFARLYDATSLQAYAIALGLVPNAARAEDVTQQAFIDIWRQAARFDVALGEPLVWIMAIVRRRALLRARLVQGEHAELVARPPRSTGE